MREQKARKVGKVLAGIVVALIVSGAVELIYFVIMWWNKMTNTGRTDFYYTTMTNMGHLVAFVLGATTFVRSVLVDESDSSKG